MDVLLILNNEVTKNARVIVNLTEKKSKKKIFSLLEKNQEKEAFDTLISNAEPHTYFPPGVPIPKRSMLIIFDEELLENKKRPEPTNFAATTVGA